MVLRFTAIVFAALLALPSSANAENLCDQQCTIDIEFPDGGSILAKKSTTFTFGDSGLVDTVGSVTAYLDGQTLVLNPGERLVFGSGGKFVLGDGGNVDVTDLVIFSNGVARISALGGAETLAVAPGRALSVFGGAGLIFKAAEVSLQGRLQLSANGQLGLYNDTATGCGISAHATDAVSISQVSVIVTADNSACERLLSLATVEVIDEDAYASADDPPQGDAPPEDDEPSDATAFSPALAAALLMPLLFGARGRRGADAR